MDLAIGTFHTVSQLDGRRPAEPIHDHGVIRVAAVNTLAYIELVRTGQHGQHAHGLVVLNETHAAHVSGQLVDLVHSFAGGLGMLDPGQVCHHVLGIAMNLIPVLRWLDITTSNSMPLGQK